MKNKQPKSQMIFKVFIIVCVLAGIYYIKNETSQEEVNVVNLELKPKNDFKTLKKQNDGSLVFLLGYFTEKKLESLKRGENIAKEFFRKNGLDVDFQYSEPDPSRAVLIEPDWDFSISNIAVTLAQYFNGVKMKPILWNKSCRLNVNIVTLKDSNIYNVSDLGGKKVLIYNFGYYSPLELDAIAKWNISKTDFYFTSDARRAYTALQNKQVEAVLSGVVESSSGEGKTSYVFGKLPNSAFKEIAITDSKLPCSVVKASLATDENKVQKMIELVNVINSKKENRAMYPGILIDYTPVSDAEFKAVLGNYNMSKLEPLKNLAKDLNEMKPADTPTSIPVIQDQGQPTRPVNNQ